MHSAPHFPVPSAGSAAVRESPRIRRLRNDLRALEQLRSESSIVDFVVPSPMFGGPPDAYLVRFRGHGLYRPANTLDVAVREEHEVSIKLGAAYPRMMPELSWRTPIFHPNISASGVVCLGGYGTYWVPSLGLDELCEMLWDMLRYRNFDVKSPYNREAATWAKAQAAENFPIDRRPIRDRVAAAALAGSGTIPLATAVPPEVQFLSEVVEAEIVSGPPRRPDVLVIE